MFSHLPKKYYVLASYYKFLFNSNSKSKAIKSELEIFYSGIRNKTISNKNTLNKKGGTDCY